MASFKLVPARFGIFLDLQSEGSKAREVQLYGVSDAGNSPDRLHTISLRAHSTMEARRIIINALLLSLSHLSLNFLDDLLDQA